MKIRKLIQGINCTVFFLVLSISFTPLRSQHLSDENLDCFSVLVGKDATFDGSVLFAHNEDDGGQQVVNWYMVPSQKHKNGEKIGLKKGALIDQAERTNRFIWLELPGMDFGDCYINEWGVTIGTNSCPSKEKEAEISDGGIGYRLRGIIAERAHSAREGVRIAGNLIEKFGYTGSGRSYCLADPNEAWIINVVKGKHWVAQRVPDDQVVIIPNYYTITDVDLSDKKNFMGADDLVEYSINKGWYDPTVDGDFNFREAYGGIGSLKSMGNIGRKWSALNILTEKEFDINSEFPFSIKPKIKVDMQILIDVLSNHYEGTELDMTNNYEKGDPHHSGRASICARTTRFGFIAQLRNWMPVEVGSVLWLAPQRPCTQAFIPWYVGIEYIPDGYGKEDYLYAVNNHYQPPGDVHEPAKLPAFWSFLNFSTKADENYKELIPGIRKQKEFFQNELFDSQNRFEKGILEIFKDNKKKATKELSKYTEKMAKKSWELAKRL